LTGYRIKLIIGSIIIILNIQKTKKENKNGEKIIFLRDKIFNLYINNFIFKKKKQKMDLLKDPVNDR
jgi:23S rRNA maturation mini-RNase III